MKNLLKLRTVALTAHEKILIAATLSLLTQSSMAFSLPGFSDLGCAMITWITGELSVLIFFIVVVITLLVGFFAKMDWTKILGIIVLFGLMKGSATLFSGFITLPAACIAV